MNIERTWGLVSGLLIGAGVCGHALRLVTLGFADGFTARHAVAGFAVLLYAVAGALAGGRHRAGLWIAILGPVCGLTAVTLSPNAQVDAFQLTLGVPQMLALVLAAYLLREDRN